jgi:transposase InsO family protein
VERFHRTVLDEFFRQVFRETFYESVAALQADLDTGLAHYNTERRRQGCGAMGCQADRHGQPVPRDC